MSFKFQTNPDEDEYPARTRRRELIALAAAGKISSRDADEAAFFEKLPPFAYSILPSAISVDREDMWSLEMVFAWVIWRSKYITSYYSRPFRKACYSWRSKRPLPAPPTSDRLPTTYSLVQMNIPSLAEIEFDWNHQKWAHITAPATKCFDDAAAELDSYTSAGSLNSYATKFDTGEEGLIPVNLLSFLVPKESKDGTVLVSRSTSAPLYKNVVFAPEQVLSIWKPKEILGSTKLKDKDAAVVNVTAVPDRIKNALDRIVKTAIDLKMAPPTQGEIAALVEENGGAYSRSSLRTALSASYHANGLILKRGPKKNTGDRSLELNEFRRILLAAKSAKMTAN